MALGWKGQYYRYKELFLNVMLLYKKRQDLKMFLEIILTLSTISFFSIVALKPTVATIAALIKEIKEKEETVSLLDRKIQDLNSARANFDQERQRVPLIEIAVPDSPTPEMLVRQLEGLALSSNVVVKSISIQELTLIGSGKIATSEEIPLPEGAKSLSFTVNASGDYASLSNFIKGIENLRRPVKIDTTTVSAIKTETGTTMMLAVSGRTPYLGNTPK